MVSDPIGDFLTRIRNAIVRGEEEVQLPSTKMLSSIAGILKASGFITDFEETAQAPQNVLRVVLKYVNGVPAIRELVRVSKPGVRKYRGYREITKIMNGLGVSIYSTPNGIITGDDAVKSQVGGEFLCYVY